MVDYAIPITDNDVVYDGHLNTQVGNMVQLLEAGENLSAGDVIYINLIDSKAYVSDTGTANDIRATGIALTTATSGNTTTMLRKGVFVTTGLTAQQDYYLGAAGAISTTMSGVRIGHAVSTTHLHIDIVQDDRAMIGTIKAYHKDMTGIPSNNLTAFWVACDGSSLSDAESPLNGQTLPDINAPKRFLRGHTTSGGTGGADTHTHAINYEAITGGTVGSVDVSKASITGSGSTVPANMEVFWIIKIK